MHVYTVVTERGTQDMSQFVRDNINSQFSRFISPLHAHVHSNVHMYFCMTLYCDGVHYFRVDQLSCVRTGSVFTTRT